MELFASYLLRPSDTYMCQYITTIGSDNGLSLARRKTKSERMLQRCLLDYWEQISVQI